MKLKELKIENILGFLDPTTIKILDDLIYFVGENGSGKTNLTRIINFIIQNFERGSVEYHKFRFWNPKEKANFEMIFELNQNEQILWSKIISLKFIILFSHQSSELKITNVELLYKFYNLLKREFNSQNVFKYMIISGETDEKSPETMKFYASFLDGKKKLKTYIDIFGIDSIFFTNIPQIPQVHQSVRTIYEIKQFNLISLNDVNKVLSNLELPNLIGGNSEDDIVINIMNGIQGILRQENKDNLEFFFRTNDLDYVTLEKFRAIKEFKEDMFSLIEFFRSKIPRFDDERNNINFYQLINRILNSSIDILVEDRGLITNSGYFSYLRGYTKNLVLSTCINDLMNMKTSIDPVKRNRYNKIKKSFHKLFNVEFELIYEYKIQEADNLNHDLPMMINLQSLGRKINEYDYIIESINDKKFYGAFPMVVFITEDETQFSLTSAPGGYIEGIMVLYALFNSESNTVVLDEPGNRFHTKYLIKLKDLIIKNRKNIEKTLIIFTHSKELIDEQNLNNVKRIIRKNNKSIIKNVNEFIDKLNINQQNKMITNLIEPFFLDLFFENKVLFVEGKWDSRVLTALNYILENPKNMNFDNLNPYGKIVHTIIRCEGKGSLLRAVQVCKFFEIEWFAIVDFDAICQNKLKESQEVWKILEVDGVEDLNESVLSDSNTTATPTEILEYCENHKIFSWEGDLESSLSTNKDKLKQMSITELIEKLEEEIKNKNKEMIRLIDFLKAKELLRERIS